MIINNLNFEAEGSQFISNPIVLNGDTTIELSFAQEGAQLFLQQSLSGEKWHTFCAEYDANTYFITTVMGIEGEIKFRVVTNQSPTTAKYA